MRALGLCIIAAGCGRIAFDDVQARSDATLDVPDVLPAHCVLDPFTALDTSRWEVAFPPSQVGVAVNGGVEITLLPFVNEYNGLSILGRADFTDAAIEIELVQATDQNGPVTETTLEIEYAPTRHFFILASQSQIVAIDRTTTDDIRMLPLDLVAHRYWRIRHDPESAMIRWQTSRDRTSWNELHAAPAPALPIDARVYIYAGQFGSGSATPGVGIFDNFRIVYPGCP